MIETEYKAASVVRIMYTTVTACLLYAVSAGLRSNYGILIGAISENSGIHYSAASFILAIGQLVFGVMQPVFGIVALKKSNRLVLVMGLLLMAMGSALTPLSKGQLSLLLSLGLALPAGTGAISFGIIMGTITPKLGRQKAAAVSGIVSASSGIGSMILSPIIQRVLMQWGLGTTMLVLAIPMLVLIPLSIPISSGGKGGPGASAEDEIHVLEMIKEALQNPSYVLITIGFFTCGFHMAIIETHLYSQFVSYGASERTAALAFAIYGLATMLGCIVSGMVSTKVKMKWVLSFLYGFRVVLIGAFLLLPKTITTIFCFAVLLGVSSAATVTPTSGITEKLFGPAKLATLFGICFLVHQMGSFFSAWLGGVCVEVTGGYTMIWMADLLLCVFACVICTRITESSDKWEDQ